MNIKELQVDLNSLFNLSYSFDSLKLMLEGMAGNQKEMIKKIKELDERMKKTEENTKEQKVTDKKIKAIENVLGSMKNAKESKKKDKTNEKVKEKEKEQKDVVKEKENIHEKDNNKETISQKEKSETELNKDKEKDKEKDTTEKKEEDNNKKEATSGSGFNQKEDSKLKALKIDEGKKHDANNQSHYDNDNDTTQKDKDNNKEGDNVNEKKEQNAEDEEEEGSDDDFNNNALFQDNAELNELTKRVTILEKKLKTIVIPKFKQEENNNDEEILMQKMKIEALTNQQIEAQEKIAALQSQLDAVSLKVNDFNIFELFKDCQTDGGNLDASKLLIMNLEAKVFKKFGIIDEKQKLLEEDSFKNKGEISNLKIQNDSNNRTFAAIKDNLQKLAEELESTNDAVFKEISESEGRLREDIGKQGKKMEDYVEALKRAINENKQKIKDLEERVNANPETTHKQGGSSLGENDLQYLKDLFKRVNELERGLKALSSSINLDVIRDELKRLKADIAQKGSMQDLYDINDKVTSQGNSIFDLKDTTEKIIEERTKLTSEINFLMKKLESINAAVITLKANDENNSNASRHNPLDTTKFLEVVAFNDFVKNYGKDVEKNKREIDELKRYLDDIAQILKTKASDEDLKNLEGFIMAKIEELRLLFNKKFADKIETNKSIKYLDAQLKHIIDVYIKKMDKGDSWLLAKKPVGGFSCASCEAYIGELQEKNDFLAWNKYPMRESQDKNYRIGNGFSRMLNMLNVDVKTTNENSNEHQYESDGELKKHPHNRNGNPNDNPKNFLPSIGGSRNEEALNMSADQADIDPNEPKVVKIVRKAKVIEIPRTAGR